MKSFQFLLSVGILLNSTPIFGQGNWSGVAYKSFADFHSKEAVDTITFDVFSATDRFIPERYSIKPLDSKISQFYLRDYVFMVYNPNYMFVNLRHLKLSKGFIRIPNPKTYNYFIGRPRKDDFNETQLVAGFTNGLIGAAISGGLEDDTRKSVPYIFSLESGKIYPFIPATLKRFLNAYPELVEAFDMDPNKEDLKTMKMYLGLLNDLIATEPSK